MQALGGVRSLSGRRRRSLHARRSFRGSWAACALLFAALCLAAPPALAQASTDLLGGDRPIDRRPIPRRTPAPSPEEAFELLPPPAPSPREWGEADAGSVAGGETVALRAVELRGNTVIETAVLEAAAEPFLGRALDAEGIEALRRRLSEVYVEAGYVNSGAVVPPQAVNEGRLVVELVEGRLAEIRISGTRSYRASVLEARLARDLAGPLAMDRLDRSLRILDQDPRIERLAARLLPGAARGEAILEVVVLEAEPRQLGLFFDNHETPSVGAYAGRIAVSHANALGFGDAIGLELTKTEGLTRLRGSYALPLHPNGPRLLVDGNATLAELVDGAFDDLDIETTNASLGIGLGQTVFQGIDDRVDLSLVFELRRSRTELLGRGFSFGDDGTESGRAEVRVLRAAADWTHRGERSALSLRSMTSFGLDVLGATHHAGDTPDGVFVSWLGQARGTYRLPRSGVELRLRGDLQLADRPLLSLEQYSVGGPGSVRGVRRNLLVRDQGFAAALDVFVPLWRSADERPIVAFVPFLDVGRAWQRDRPTSGKRTISGAGAGLAWSPHPQLEFEVEFAKAIRETDDSGDLQDDGVYLRAVGWAF